MIINVPTVESLRDVALSLYFSAWSDLIHILSDFEETYPTEANEWHIEPPDWSKERAEYLSACQSELRSVCTVIQQSNELALKSKICEVSPFLLLRNDSKLSTVPKEFDFSDFKTLDAVELPGAVNTFCTVPLTDEFIRTYNLIRSLRNKIIHLGQTDKIFQPEELMHLLVFQYVELWRKRGWLRDRVQFASSTRSSFFHDYKYSSPHMVVMHELPFTFEILTNSEFKQLFGHSKDTQRHLCHECVDNASTRFASLDLDVCKTAVLDATSSHLSCTMCGMNFKVAHIKCVMVGCKGNLVGNNADEHAGKCHCCGEYQTAEL